MKNYLIETTTNGYFVHAGDTPYGGPYKNEESAKRRIRDLKRKDKEQTEIVADMQATGMMPTAPTPVVAFKQDDMTNQTPQCEAPEIDPVETKIEAANDKLVEKLAASSEYGKSNALAAGMNNLDMSKFKITKLPVHHVGCYPHISKHENSQRFRR